MKKIMFKYFSLTVFLTLNLNVLAFANEGFDDVRIIELLDYNAKKNGLQAVEIIDAANEAIGDGDTIRYLITLEGELLFLDDNSKLFAVVGLGSVGNAEPRALICRANIAAMRKRTRGIAYFTDDISADEARSDSFRFIRSNNPSKTFEEFAVEYEDIHQDIVRGEELKKRLNNHEIAPECNLNKRVKKDDNSLEGLDLIASVIDRIIK